ncbi:MAG: hypothetical protein ACI9HK_004681 [Pirellulaceae bacterium]|jgi:hypothetical protein
MRRTLRFESLESRCLLASVTLLSPENATHDFLAKGLDINAQGDGIVAWYDRVDDVSFMQLLRNGQLYQDPIALGQVASADGEVQVDCNSNSVCVVGWGDSIFKYDRNGSKLTTESPIRGIATAVGNVAINDAGDIAYYYRLSTGGTSNRFGKFNADGTSGGMIEFSDGVGPDLVITDDGDVIFSSSTGGNPANRVYKLNVYRDFHDAQADTELVIDHRPGYFLIPDEPERTTDLLHIWSNMDDLSVEAQWFSTDGDLAAVSTPHTLLDPPTAPRGFRADINSNRNILIATSTASLHYTRVFDSERNLVQESHVNVNLPERTTSVTAAAIGEQHILTTFSQDNDGLDAYLSIDTLSIHPQVQSIVINAEPIDPPDLPERGLQPTSWQQQRSSIESLTIEFSEDVNAMVTDFTLTNLGINAPVDSDELFVLDADNFQIAGSTVKLLFEPDELTDGVYQLSVSDGVTDLDGNQLEGGDFQFIGNTDNKFYQLEAEWSGDNGVSVFDFETFGYWFGISTIDEPLAPQCADLNRDGGVSIFDFAGYSGNFGKGVTYPAEVVSLVVLLIEESVPREQRQDAIEQVVEIAATVDAWGIVARERIVDDANLEHQRESLDELDLDLEAVIDALANDVGDVWA